MPPNSVSNEAIWERLGALTAQTEAVLRELNRASDGRKELYDRLRAVEDLAADSADILKDLKPAVDDFRHLKAKAGGVVLVLVFIGSVLTAIVSLFIDQIKAAFGWGGP